MGEDLHQLSPLNYIKAQIKILETLLEVSLPLLKEKDAIITLSKKIFSLCEDTFLYLEKIRPAPALACSRGCGHCCHNLIEINPFWSFVALEGLNNVSLEKKTLIEGRIAKEEPYQFCPFLVDNICSIYEARPPVCRGYYSLKLQECFKGNYCEKDLIPPEGYRGEEAHSVYHYMVFLYILEHRLKLYEEKCHLQASSLFLHDAVRVIFRREEMAKNWLKGEKIF